MKNDGITIDKVYESFSEPGISGADFKKVEEKQPIKDAKAAVIEWVSKTVGDTEALWEIPISKADNALGFSVAVNHIQSAVGVSYSVAQTHRGITTPLIEKMIEEGILVIPSESYEAAGIENTRKLLNWYRQLSVEEKHTLPIFGNKISIGKMSSEQLPIKKGSLKFNVVKDAWEFIHQDLEKLGIIDANYKSVA